MTYNFNAKLIYILINLDLLKNLTKQIETDYYTINSNNIHKINNNFKNNRCFNKISFKLVYDIICIAIFN